MERKKRMNEDKYIKCVDKNDMEATAYQLWEELRVDTKFCYEKDGVEGFWLEIKEILTKVEDDKERDE